MPKPTNQGTIKDKSKPLTRNNPCVWSPIRMNKKVISGNREDIKIENRGHVKAIEYAP